MADTRPLADAITKATTTQHGVTKFAEDGEATIGEAVQSNDSRLSNGRPPTGAAGGVLNGSYPNPTFAVTPASVASVTAAQADADAAQSTADAAATAAADAVSDLAAHVVFVADADTLGHVTLDQVQALVDATAGSADFIELPLQIDAPDTPASGFVRIYQAVGGLTYVLDELGVSDELAKVGAAIDAALITTGVIDPDRLGFDPATDYVLRGDSTWGQVTDAMMENAPAHDIDLTNHAATIASQSVTGHTSFEAIQDMLVSFFPNGTGVTWTYNDVANTLTLTVDVSAISGAVAKAGDTMTGQLNLIFTVTDPVAGPRAIFSTLTVVDNANNAQTIEGGRFDIQVSPVSGVSHTGQSNGIVAFGRNIGAGTVTTLRAARFQVLGSNGGIITTGFGFYADSPSLSGGATIATLYAIYLGPQKVAGVTVGYGIYQAGTTDLNFFAGLVGFGNATPLNDVEVSKPTGGILTLRRVDASVTAGDMIGKIQFYAADTSSVTNFNVAEIEAQATNTVTTDINPGRLIFRTTPVGVAAVPTEAMRIDEAQRVGVGVTATLVEQVEVNGRVKATGFVGVPRVLGGWVSELAPSIVDHYGSITLIVDVDSTFVDVIGYAVTAPSGTAATFDIEYKRGAGAWTSLYSVLPTFAVGANSPSVGTKSTTALNAGDLIRLNWDAVNGLAGVTLAMKLTTR